MPEFIADTDGVVNGMEFSDLSDFFQGYVEAMLFTETSAYSMVEWEEEETQEAIREGTSDGNIPSDAGWGDIHPEAAERMQLDCFNFEAQAGDILREAVSRPGYDMAQAGRDFWYTRNGHGVGFWDRKELENVGVWEACGSPRVGEPGWDDYKAASANSIGDQLSAIARTFGERYVGFEADPESPTGYGYVHID